MARYLVLFAREPERQARDKGFSPRGAADFFARLAEDWWQAALSVGARLVVASPPEDRLAWRSRLGRSRPHLWIVQRGASFGECLESSGRAAAALGGHFVIVGGDVVPSPTALEHAFAALKAGADAVLSPAPDGGVSLLALRPGDMDLLKTIAPRRTDVFVLLRSQLISRRRRVSVVAATPDVDGRRGLRALLGLPASIPPSGPLREMARCALARPAPPAFELALPLDVIRDRDPVSPRGPPVSV